MIRILPHPIPNVAGIAKRKAKYLLRQYNSTIKRTERVLHQGTALSAVEVEAMVFGGGFVPSDQMTTSEGMLIVALHTSKAAYKVTDPSRNA